jgi:hypothetical protein
MKHPLFIQTALITLLLSANFCITAAGDVVYAWGFPYQNYKIPLVCDSPRYVWLDSLSGKTWYVPDSVTEFYPGGEARKDQYALFGDRGNGFVMMMPLNIVYLLDNSSAAARADPTGLRFRIIDSLLSYHIVLDTLNAKRELTSAGFMTFSDSIRQLVPMLDVSTFSINQHDNRWRLLDSLTAARITPIHDQTPAKIGPAIDTALSWLKNYPNRYFTSKETAIIIVSAGTFDDNAAWRAVIDNVYPDSSAPFIYGSGVST